MRFVHLRGHKRGVAWIRRQQRSTAIRWRQLSAVARQGTTREKKVKGRKCHLAVDVEGTPIVIRPHEASV